jgi:hypothetical protein
MLKNIDARASLQPSYVPASQHIKSAFNGKREAQPSRFSNFEKIVLNVVRLVEPKIMHVCRL